MYAEAKTRHETFSSVQTNSAIQERLTVVCSEIIHAQTLLTSGRCVLMLLKPLYFEKENNESTLLCHCYPNSVRTSLLMEGPHDSPIYLSAKSSLENKVYVFVRARV